MFQSLKILVNGVAACASLLLAGAAQAVPVVVALQGVGSGSLGGSAFSDTSFSIIATGDTDNLISVSAGQRISDTLATVSVQGLGPAVPFIVSTTVSANWNTSALGIGNVDQNRAILFVAHPNVAGYMFAADLGPLTGTPTAINVGFAHETSIGAFVLNGVSSANVSVSVVPEPAPAAMFLLGGLVLAWRRWAGVRA